MFEFPLRRTYELISEQLKLAKRAKKVTMKVCSCVQIITQSADICKYVFMVGGFSESPYVYRKVMEFVETSGLQAIRPAYP